LVSDLGLDFVGFLGFWGVLGVLGFLGVSVQGPSGSWFGEESSMGNRVRGSAISIGRHGEVLGVARV
jgi:hypothetical protein